jgi:rhodanese-related sulfurtransferase
MAIPVDAVALARQLVAAPEDVWLLDLRPAGPADLRRIPGAMALPAGDVDAAVVASLSPTRQLVVYGKGDLRELPAGVTSFSGQVVVLTGGWNAWQAAVLTPPVPPTTPTPALVAEFQMRNALHARFTGATAAVPVKVEIKSVSSAASGPRKGGGC